MIVLNRRKKSAVLLFTLNLSVFVLIQPLLTTCILQYMHVCFVKLPRVETLHCLLFYWQRQKVHKLQAKKRCFTFYFLLY